MWRLARTAPGCRWRTHSRRARWRPRRPHLASRTSIARSSPALSHHLADLIGEQAGERRLRGIGSGTGIGVDLVPGGPGGVDDVDEVVVGGHGAAGEVLHLDAVVLPDGLQLG